MNGRSVECSSAQRPSARGASACAGGGDQGLRGPERPDRPERVLGHR
jgi:hypothetical protein